MITAMKKIQRLNISGTEKRLRALVIKRYMERNGIERAVCFSCGHASDWLKTVGVKTLDISPSGDMLSRRWFTQEEIRTLYPLFFDATSGHLPLFLMREIAKELKREITLTDNLQYYVSSGSGETAVCLKLAYPQADIVPVYNSNDPATTYSPFAPLNDLVEALFPKIEKL